jgi:acyl-CoA dehydrogenase
MTAHGPSEVADAVADLVKDIVRRHDGSPQEAAAAIAGLGLELIGQPHGSGGEPADLAAALAAVGRAGVGAPVLSRAVAQWVLARAGAPEADGPATVAFGGGEVVLAPWARDCERLVLCRPSGSVTVVALDASAVHADVDLAGDPLDRVDLNRLPRPEPLPRAPATDAIGARAAILSAAQLGGLADGALELTRRYVRQRHQFGGPLLKLPAVARGLAEMQVRVTEAAAGVDVGLAGLGDPVAAAIAFTAAATAATAVARIAHQLHGAIGVTAEYSLHRWTTRIWSGRDWPRPQSDWMDQLGQIRTEELAWQVTAFDRP